MPIAPLYLTKYTIHKCHPLLPADRNACFSRVRPERSCGSQEPFYVCASQIESTCIMDSNRVAMFALTMCALLLLSLQQGAQGARMLIARAQGELPPCKDVPGGIAGWDCFDPPTTPLPPCDFKHQRPGFDCWPKSPPSAKVMVVADEAAAAGAPTTQKSAAHRVDGMLPPCKDVPGGIAGFDCFDPPTTPLPPCDFRHQRAGFDCWPKSPPAARP